MKRAIVWAIAACCGSGFVQAGGPEQLAERNRADIAKWGKVARAANVRIE